MQQVLMRIRTIVNLPRCGIPAKLKQTFPASKSQWRSFAKRGPVRRHYSSGRCSAEIGESLQFLLCNAALAFTTLSDSHAGLAGSSARLIGKIDKGPTPHDKNSRQEVDTESESLFSPLSAFCSGCGVKFQQEDPNLPG